MNKAKPLSSLKHHKEKNESKLVRKKITKQNPHQNKARNISQREILQKETRCDSTGEYKSKITKKKQNKYKNLPGLIMQKVHKSIKEYFNNSENPRFIYLNHALSQMRLEDRAPFLVFLKGFNKNWKTWRKIYNFLKDSPYRQYVIDSIVGFLGNDGVEDLEDWYIKGNLGEENKNTLRKGKDFIQEKFRNLLGKEDWENFLNFSSTNTYNTYQTQNDISVSNRMEEERFEGPFLPFMDLKNREFYIDEDSGF